MVRRSPGRDDERPRGQGVRGHERDDVALHAPRHHRPAVGQVVARGALRRGDDQPVAAHAADLLARRARTRGRRPGGPACGARRCRSWPSSCPRAGRRRSSGSSSVSKSPANARSKCAAEAVRVDRGQEPHLAEVDREDRHARPGVHAQRREDRAVAADAPCRGRRRRGGRSRARSPAPGSSPCLRVSPSSKRSSDARRGARRRSARASPARCRSTRRWVNTDAALTRPPPPGRRRGPRSRPAGPARPATVNVSRLPAGPGRPDDAKPITAPRARRPATRGDRRAPRRGVPHHAALPDVPAAHLELRLDHHQAVERSARAGQHRREHLARAR